MTCSDDGSLRVWNMQTGQQIASWEDGESGIHTIALSADGKKVVSGSYDGVVRLWSIETGKVIARCTGHTNTVTSVCWNGDGDRVLSGCLDGTARVWNVEIRNTVLEINTGLDRVYTATFSPDSTLIATDGWSPEDERIKIWDANTGKLVAILKGHTGWVNCLAWTADGTTLISGSEDYTIRFWNISTWQQLAVLTGHTNSVRRIAISPNGRILASASWDETVRLWNLDNGQPIPLPLQHPEAVDCVSFSTDGKLLATGCSDNNAYTWDVSAIIKEAGLIELLDGEKPFLNADATRRPVQKPKNVRTIPTNFFAESDPDITPSISPPVLQSACPIPLPAVPEDTPPEAQPNPPERSPFRLFKWLRLNTPAQPTFLQRAKLPFFKQPGRQDEEGVQLKERQQVEVVDVPLAPGRLRIATVEVKKKTKNRAEDETPQQANIANKSKNMRKIAKKSDTNVQVATRSQSPTQSNIIQQSSSQSQAQLSSESPPAALTPSAVPATGNPTLVQATMSVTPARATITLHAGCLTHFLLRIGCVSAPRAGGHH